MRLRIISFLLILLFLLPIFLSGCMSIYAEEKDALPEMHDESFRVISPAIDALGLSEITGKSMGNHGANQNRVVYTSSGVYLGVMVTPKHPHITDELAYACMVRVNPDGSVDTIYKDFIRGANSSTTVTIMADKNEDIWMYSGWEGNGEFYFKLWHYDVSEDRVTAYTSVQKLVLENSYGYSVAMIDVENDKIFALAPGGDVPGYMMWCEFDITTLEWKQHLAVYIDARCCYLHAYPDGNGGFVMLGERDVHAKSVKSDVGLNVEEADQKYHSRSYEAEYVWDELRLLHIADPSVAEIDVIVIEEATYDVVNGIYPDMRNGFGDMFVGSDGYLHVLYTVVNDGIPGNFMYHKAFDMSDGMKEIFFDRIDFLYGANTLYCARMYEDVNGNVYVLAMPTIADASIEIWKATNELCTEFKMVHVETLRGVEGAGGSAFILANSRNNSTPSTAASFILSGFDTWFSFTVDLSSFAD